MLGMSVWHGSLVHHYSERLIYFSETFRLINEHVCGTLLFNVMKRSIALQVTALSLLIGRKRLYNVNFHKVQCK